MLKRIKQKIMVNLVRMKLKILNIIMLYEIYYDHDKLNYEIIFLMKNKYKILIIKYLQLSL